MKQLELFDGMDEVRFVMSLTPTQLDELKSRVPFNIYHRVREIRHVVNRWNSMCKRVDIEYKSNLRNLGIEW